MNFTQKLQSAAQRNQSWLCVGLDPDLEKIPQHLIDQHGSDAIIYFTKAIVDATREYVCAYKPNSAFYESLGPMGLEMLKVTREIIPNDIPMILDAKRGDLGNSSKHYAKAAFEVYGADCLTLSPYMGLDSLQPFIDYGDRGLFILCRTSNPSAKEIQDLDVGGQPLYLKIAQQIARWRDQSQSSHIGAVVGATYPDELKSIRDVLGNDLVILIPGIGSQGGDLQAAVLSGMNSSGQNGIINASRSVIFASSGEDFADEAGSVTKALRDQINDVVRSTG